MPTMNQSLKSLALLLLVYHNFFAVQGQKPAYQSNYALLNILVEDPDYKPIEEVEVTLRGLTNKIHLRLVTGKTGSAEALVPAGHTYTLDVGQILNADKVEIPDENGYELELKFNVNRRFATSTLMAEVVFMVNNSDGKPLSEKFKVVSLSNQKAYEVNTDQSGTAEILLPAGENFRLDFPDAVNYFRFTLPRENNHRQTLKISFSGSGHGTLHPTIDKILVRIHYYDFDDRGVPGEEIQIRGEDRGKEYTVVTNDSGWVSLLLPKGDRYFFSTQLLKNFQRIAAPLDEQLMERTVLLKYISTRGYYQYMEKIEREERRRDSIYQVQAKIMQDFFNDLREKSQQGYLAELKKRQNEQFIRLLLPVERKNYMVERAKEEEREVENNFTYFEKERKSVSAPFFRFREKWNDKVVVIDVTCSMDPYVNQVMAWLAMKFSQNQKARYVYFNDGDGKPVSEKHIGNTGGFHYTETTHIESALARLYNAESFGCSGDVPENDLEALLFATQYMNRGSELILIADNLSRVRDMELLPQLKVPVRIILCGLDGSELVHPDYLEIAYHTGGSIHTITEDIMNLKKKVDKDQLVEINRRIYHYRYGKFVPGMKN